MTRCMFAGHAPHCDGTATQDGPLGPVCDACADPAARGRRLRNRRAPLHRRTVSADAPAVLAHERHHPHPDRRPNYRRYL